MSWPAAIAWLSVAAFALLAVAFWRAPAATMARTGHRPDGLPAVMGSRYAGMAMLVAAAWLIGGARMLAATLAILGVLGVIDAFIYYRRGAPFVPHLVAAALGVAAAGIVCAAARPPVS